MYQNNGGGARRRLKKLRNPNYGLRDVVIRRSSQDGYGLTISGQQPCILSCIVPNSVADLAGLRPGDFLINVNGVSVSKMPHDSVVDLISRCGIEPVTLTIAEHFYNEETSSSSSSTTCEDSDSEMGVTNQQQQQRKTSSFCDLGPPLKRLQIGYVGTIDRPASAANNVTDTQQRLLAASIRKLRSEKRTPTPVLMCFYATTLTLQQNNPQHSIIAVYPRERIVYAGADHGRHVGLITRAAGSVSSYSCHVFCANATVETAHCVGLLRTFYCHLVDTDENIGAVEQRIPSAASSTSDSGIGYRDENVPPAQLNDLNAAHRNHLALHTLNINDVDRRLTCRVLVGGGGYGGDSSFSSDENNMGGGGTNAALRRRIGVCYDTKILNNSPDVLFKVPSSVRLMAVARRSSTSRKLLLPPRGGGAGSALSRQKQFGSLCDLSGRPSVRNRLMVAAASSEPDVRIPLPLPALKRNNCQYTMLNNSNQEIMAGGVDEESHNSSGVHSITTIPATFEALLEDSAGLTAFTEFLRTEFSSENITFWSECEQYRRQCDTGERRAHAQRIYEQYLSANAPEPVNIDARIRQTVTEAVTNMSVRDSMVGIFGNAQKHVANLMKFDSYPRFLKSTVYTEYCKMHTQKTTTTTTAAAAPPSKSTRDTARRKSLRPWRTKSKDRIVEAVQDPLISQSESGTDERESTAGGGGVGGADRTAGSLCGSWSSLASLDLAMATLQDENCTPALCRVILPNSSTTVVQIKAGETVGQLIERVLRKRAIQYSAYDVYTGGGGEKPQPTTAARCVLDKQESAQMRLNGCDVTVDQRIVFKLDLPNRKVISVKSKRTKLIRDVLRPILMRYGYDLNQCHASIVQHENGGVGLQIDDSVETIDGARVRISTVKSTISQQQQGKSDRRMEEITNLVFADILSEKSMGGGNIAGGGGLDTTACDSLMSDDWSSEHSSSTAAVRHLAVADCRTITQPLIAKWTTAANKLQISGIVDDHDDADDTMEGLIERAQHSRLDDQRGTQIRFELPAFLRRANSGEDSVGPPPLPPKPKIVPIRSAQMQQQQKSTGSSSGIEDSSSFICG